MDKQITFRNMDHSSVMEDYINDQLAKIEEFLKNETEPIYIHLVLTAGYTHHHHRVELSIKSPHFKLFSDYEGPEMYDVIDRVIDVMYRMLLEKKREQIDERKEGFKKREIED